MGKPAILIAIYKAVAHVWDFSEADLCVFAQQPWVPNWKTNCLGRFFHAGKPRTTKLEVINLDVDLGINGLVREFWANGLKVRGGLIGAYIAKTTKEVNPETDPLLNLQKVHDKFIEGTA